MGIGLHQTALLALTTTIFQALQGGGKTSREITSTRPGWASEEPGVVHGVWFACDRLLKLLNCLRLTKQFIPNRVAQLDSMVITRARICC